MSVVCPVIEYEFRHNIVKVTVEIRYAMAECNPTSNFVPRVLSLPLL